MSVNMYGLKMLGLKEVAGRTKELKDNKDKEMFIIYHEQTGKVGLLVYLAGSNTLIDSIDVGPGWLPIGMIKVPVTMQDIADKIQMAVQIRYRTKEEMIDYFEKLAYEFSKQAHRTKDGVARGKAEAYELAAFELKHNMR